MFVTFCWNTFLAYYRNRFAYQEIQPRTTCDTKILRISNISRQAHQAGHTSGTNSYPLDRLNIFSFSDAVEMDMFLRTEKTKEIPCYKAIDFRGVQSVTTVEEMQCTCTSTLLKCLAAGQYFQPKFSFLQSSDSVDNRTAEATSHKVGCIPPARLLSSSTMGLLSMIFRCSPNVVCCFQRSLVLLILKAMLGFGVKKIEVEKTSHKYLCYCIKVGVPLTPIKGILFKFVFRKKSCKCSFTVITN